MRADAPALPALTLVVNRPSSPRHFLVSVTHPDGRCENYQRLGGQSMDHLIDAIDRAGIGGVVRVMPQPAGQAA